MSSSLPEYTGVIFPEMMSHPALFSHPHPKKIAVWGDENNRILLEVLKHPNVEEVEHDYPAHADTRVHLRTKNNQTDCFDIIINASPFDHTLLLSLFNQLKKDGILIQQSDSPFQISHIKKTAEELKIIGFKDLQFLNFPQPYFHYGWRTAIMALKQGVFKRPSEKIIFNKPFKTDYYNYDIHKAAAVLPEFIRHQNIF